MKNKAFIPYLIIEFLLFIASTIIYFGGFDFNLIYFYIISFVVSLVFVLFMVPRNKKSKYFAIAFVSLMLVGEILNITTLSGGIPYIFSFLAFAVLLAYTIYDKKIKRFYIDLSIVAALIVIVNVVLIILKVNTLYMGLACSTIILAVNNVVLGIYAYNKSEFSSRPNCFFFATGSAFYAIYRLCLLLSTFPLAEASIGGLIMLSIVSFFIPSTILLSVSFMLFEPREA